MQNVEARIDEKIIVGLFVDVGQVPIPVEFASTVWDDILLGGRHQGYIEATFLMKFIDAGIISLYDDIAISDKKGFFEITIQKFKAAGGA
jgi:hypothetical protein